MGYGLCSRLALRLVGLPPKSIDLVATKQPITIPHYSPCAPNAAKRTKADIQSDIKTLNLLLFGRPIRTIPRSIAITALYSTYSCGIT